MISGVVRFLRVVGRCERSALSVSDQVLMCKVAKMQADVEVQTANDAALITFLEMTGQVAEVLSQSLLHSVLPLRSVCRWLIAMPWSRLSLF